MTQDRIFERCRQFVGAGENRLGIAGFLERAEAVVAAAQGEYAVAETISKKRLRHSNTDVCRGMKPTPFNSGAAR